jgi:hypothetical protein
MTFFICIYILLRVITLLLFYLILLNYQCTLFIAKVVYYLNNLYSPFGTLSPHSFHSQCLTSGFSLEETHKNISKTKKILSETRQEIDALKQDIKILKSATTLHNAGIDLSQNNILKDLKKEYPSFFDENTDKEGLDQLHEYFTEELKTHTRIHDKNTKKVLDWYKEIKEFRERNPSNGSSSNSDVKKETTPNMDNQNLLPLVPMFFNSNYLIYFYRNVVYLFKLLLPLLGIIVSLDLISITIPNFLGIFSNFFFNRLVFLWSCFRIFRNILFYIKIFGYVRSFVNTIDHPDFLLVVLITVFSIVLPFCLEIKFSIDILLCS